MPENQFRGIVDFIGDKKFAFVREFTHNRPKGKNDAFVPPPIIKRFRLRDGVVIEGTLRPGRKGDMQVHRVTSVMGVDPQVWIKFRDFKLTY